MRHPSQRVVEKLSTALKLNAQDLYLLANPRVRSLLGKAKPGCAQRLTVAAVHPECFFSNRKTD